MDVDYAKLWKSIRRSDEQLRAPLDNYRERLKKFVGFKHTKNGWPVPQPFNLIALQTNIISNHLVSNTPQASLRARPFNLRSYAKTFEVSLNNRLMKMRLGKTMNSAVRSAMFFGQSVVKIGWTMGPNQPGNGRLGGVYCENIQPDNLVIDMAASRMDEIEYIGNRYCMPLDYVLNADIFNDKARSATAARGYADRRGGGRAQDISSGTDYGEGVVDMVRLIDLWLPFHNKFVTLLDTGEQEPIREDEWKGSVNGPYRTMQFIEVPDNLLGVAPVSLIEDVHDSINEALNKVRQGVTDYKENVLAPLAARADMEAQRDAKNGEYLTVSHAGGTEKVAFGGPNQAIVGVSALWINMGMEIAGNLRTLGGLATQAGTLGQEELLDKSANKLVAAMQNTVVDFTADAMKVIAELHWFAAKQPGAEPEIVTKTVGKSQALAYFPRKNEATGETEHQGEWDDYAIDIIPWSLTKKSPAERMNGITQLLMQILLPAAQIMAQQGVSINFPGYIELRKRLLDEGPELDEILMRSDPQGAAEQQPDGGASASNFSHRVYERRNVPGASRQQQDQMMANLAFGGDAQDAEKATLARSA